MPEVKKPAAAGNRRRFPWLLVVVVLLVGAWLIAKQLSKLPTIDTMGKITAGTEPIGVLACIDQHAPLEIDLRRGKRAPITLLPGEPDYATVLAILDVTAEPEVLCAESEQYMHEHSPYVLIRQNGKDALRIFPRMGDSVVCVPADDGGVRSYFYQPPTLWSPRLNDLLRDVVMQRRARS